MPRAPNLVETVQVRISTTPMVEERLAALVRTGLYGKNTAEAAERLVAEGLIKILREGLLLNETEDRPGGDD